MEMKTASYGQRYSYPAAVHAVVGRAEDWSYGNDTCAHIHLWLPGREVCLFVEHEAPSKREDEGTPRWTVLNWDEDEDQPDITGESFETDNPYELIGYLFIEGER